MEEKIWNKTFGGFFMSISYGKFYTIDSSRIYYDVNNERKVITNQVGVETEEGKADLMAYKSAKDFANLIKNVNEKKGKLVRIIPVQITFENKDSFQD